MYISYIISSQPTDYLWLPPLQEIKWKYKLQKEKRSEQKTLHQKTAEKRHIKCRMRWGMEKM
jgi:hypothetical protein